MTSASAVFFGVEMPESLLAAEVQNHTASSIAEARKSAGRALAAKALLLDRANVLGLIAEPEKDANGAEETEEEALIREVLSEDVEVSAPTPEEVRAMYDKNPEGFRSPPLIEASHILIAPRDNSDEASMTAKEQAMKLISELASSPKQFEQFASKYSDCPSSSDRGSLGQLRPGDVIPAIWTALLNIDAGQISETPVQTEYGWHVLRVDHRVDGERLPFEHVEPHISMQLESRKWTLAAAQYVDALLQASDMSRGLKLTDDGRLFDGESTLGRSEGILGEALSNASGSIDLLSDDVRNWVETESCREGVSSVQFVQENIGQFLSQADDKAWTQLISKLRDDGDLVSDCLNFVLMWRQDKTTQKHTLLNTLQSGGVGS